MTCREKLAMEHPECISKDAFGGCINCPYDYGYVKHRRCIEDEYDTPDCAKCWDQEVETESNNVNQIDIHKIIDDAMEKKDRTVSIHIGESGVSIRLI